MSLDKCPICGEYDFGHHKCKPAFYVFRDEDDIYGYFSYSSDPKAYYASDEESAAIEYCEHDYEMPSELEVIVIKQKDWYDIEMKFSERDDNGECDADGFLEDILLNSKKFSMESEIVRNFYATEISNRS